METFTNFWKWDCLEVDSVLTTPSLSPPTLGLQFGSPDILENPAKMLSPPRVCLTPPEESADL